MANAQSIPLRTVVDDAELHVSVVPETLRAGALDEPVRWAHISELTDPAPYLLGAELLLSAGVNLPTGQAAVHRYVRGLRDSGVTALGFGITPPMHEELPDRLRRACVRAGLPLLVVPQKTPFLAVSRAVALALQESEQRDQRRIAEARTALTGLAPGGIPEIVDGLARLLSGWVLLLDALGQPVVDSAAPRPHPAEVDGLTARLRGGSGVRSAATELPDGTHVVAWPVDPHADSPTLVVGRLTRFAAADAAIASAGADLLGLLGRADSDTVRLGAAATALLTGSAADDVLATLAPSAEGTEGVERRVVAGVRRSTPLRPDEMENEYGRLRFRLRTPLARLFPDRFEAITDVAAGGSEELAALSNLSALSAYGWLSVATRPLPAERLSESGAEIACLLERARALDRPVLAGAENALSELVPADAGARFARDLLGPLREEPLLLDTLRAWLASHGGWDRTAAQLGVHRNSVRHRIARVERLLGVDLADAEKRMELWFALRWL